MLNAIAGKHQQQQEHGERAAQAEVADAERRLPQLQRDHVRVALRRPGGDHEHEVEDLQHVDHQGHEDDGEHGSQQRHGDLAEDLPLVATVDPRRFEGLPGIAARPGGDDHHGEAGPDPDVRHDDRRRDERRAEPADAAERLAEVRRRGAAARRRLHRARRARTCRRARSSPSPRPLRRRRLPPRRRAGRARRGRWQPGSPPSAGREVEPDGAGDAAIGRGGLGRLHASVGDRLRRDRDEAEGRGLADADGVRRSTGHRRPSARGPASSDGRAPGSSPGDGPR